MKIAAWCCIGLVGTVGLSLSAVGVEMPSEEACLCKNGHASTNRANEPSPNPDPLLFPALDLRRQFAFAALRTELHVAQREYKIAQLALREYTEGVYGIEREIAESAVVVAQKRHSRQEEKLARIEAGSEEKAEALNVKKQTFACLKAKQALELAQMKLKVLNEYTKPRIVGQLEARVGAAKDKMDLLANQYITAEKAVERGMEQMKKQE